MTAVPDRSRAGKLVTALHGPGGHLRANSDVPVLVPIRLFRAKSDCVELIAVGKKALRETELTESTTIDRKWAARGMWSDRYRAHRLSLVGPDGMWAGPRENRTRGNA